MKDAMETVQLPLVKNTLIEWKYDIKGLIGRRDQGGMGSYSDMFKRHIWFGSFKQRGSLQNTKGTQDWYERLRRYIDGRPIDNGKLLSVKMTGHSWYPC
jgi:hypothetical protein